MQRLLPAAFELARHEPISRVHRLIMTAGKIGLIVGPFEPLLPEGALRFTRLQMSRLGLEHGLHPQWRERFQHQLLERLLQSGGTEGLTHRFCPLALWLRAYIPQVQRAGVADLHGAPAACA